MYIFYEYYNNYVGFDVSWYFRNYCCFAFGVSANCLLSFQSFVLRHLVITPVCNTKKQNYGDRGRCYWPNYWIRLSNDLNSFADLGE